MTIERQDFERLSGLAPMESQGHPDGRRRVFRIGRLLGFGPKCEPAISPPTLPPEDNRANSFNPNTITRGPIGGRDLRRYASILLFDREELRDKRVLDLGSGSEARLARQLSKLGITDEVVSLSPDYSNAEHASRAMQTGAKALVSGIGEALPFGDGSFDRVLALFSHVHSKDPVALVGEVGRVLAPKGVGNIGPCTGQGLYRDVLANNDVADYLTIKGIQMENIKIPQQVAEFRTFDPYMGVAVAVDSYVLRLTRF